MECIITVGKENKAIVNEIAIDEITEQNVMIEIDNINILKDMDIKKIFDYLFSKLEEKSKGMYSFMVIGLPAKYQRTYNLLMEAKKANDLFITIRCNKSKIASYIDMFKRTKEKITIECTDLSLSEYFQILKNYTKEELESMNIDINYHKNNSPIHISKLYTVSQTINNIASEVNNYNLSDLEKIMYVYDLVKKRIYIRDESDWRNSRDLDKVLSNDSIVCVGYSNLFNAILNTLGIKAMPLNYSIANHQRSIVYVKDDKYNIDGIYTFDPTGDNRRNENDEHYLERYRYFAIPLSKAGIIIPEAKKLAYDTFTPVLKMGIDKINETLKDSYDPAARELLTILNNMLMFASDRKLKRTDCITKEEYDCLQEKFGRSEVTPDVFVRLLYTVRKIEYQNGTIDVFDIESIKETVQKLYETKFRTRNKAYSNELNWFFSGISYDIEESINNGIKALNNKTTKKRR